MSIKSLTSSVKSRLRSSFTINSVKHCVTELVLNSLDAKSSAIAVRINLVTLRIQVVDNGHGISKSDMDLVGVRYATSKCQSLKQLSKKPKKYGFRGEALASILSLSQKVNITSRLDGSKDTYSKTYVDRKWQSVVSVHFRPSQGTTITVERFFYSMPVRQKQIKPNLDFEEIKLIIENLALIHPNVSFSLRNDINGNIEFHSRKTASVAEALVNIYPDLKTDNLEELKVRKNKISVSGLIHKFPYNSRKIQLIYVNKRPTDSIKIQKLIKKLLSKSNFFQRYDPYGEICDSNTTHAVYIFNISCPQADVDISLDQLKTNVEFKQWDIVLRCIEKLITRFLESEDLITHKALADKDYIKYNKSDKRCNSNAGISQIEGVFKSIPIKRKTEVAKNNENVENKKTKLDSPKRQSSSNVERNFNYNRKHELFKENPQRGTPSVLNRCESIIEHTGLNNLHTKKNVSNSKDVPNKADNNQLFNKHTNTQSLVLNSEFTKYYKEDCNSKSAFTDFQSRNKQSVPTNTEINNPCKENCKSKNSLTEPQSKGKELLMDIFLKSTLLFKSESPKSIFSQKPTFTNNQQKQKTNCNTMMTVSLKIRSQKTVVKSSVYTIRNAITSSIQKNKKKETETQTSDKALNNKEITERSSKCVQTTLLEQKETVTTENEKEFKFHFNLNGNDHSFEISPAITLFDILNNKSFIKQFNKFHTSKEEDNFICHHSDKPSISVNSSNWLSHYRNSETNIQHRNHKRINSKYQDICNSSDSENTFYIERKYSLTNLKNILNGNIGIQKSNYCHTTQNYFTNKEKEHIFVKPYPVTKSIRKYEIPYKHHKNIHINEEPMRTRNKRKTYPYTHSKKELSCHYHISKDHYTKKYPHKIYKQGNMDLMGSTKFHRDMEYKCYNDYKDIFKRQINNQHCYRKTNKPVNNNITFPGTYTEKKQYNKNFKKIEPLKSSNINFKLNFKNYFAENEENQKNILTNCDKQINNYCNRKSNKIADDITFPGICFEKEQNKDISSRNNEDFEKKHFQQKYEPAKAINVNFKMDSKSDFVENYKKILMNCEDCNNVLEKPNSKIKKITNSSMNLCDLTFDEKSKPPENYVDFDNCLCKSQIQHSKAIRTVDSKTDKNLDIEVPKTKIKTNHWIQIPTYGKTTKRGPLKILPNVEKNSKTTNIFDEDKRDIKAYAKVSKYRKKNKIQKPLEQRPKDLRNIFLKRFNTESTSLNKESIFIENFLSQGTSKIPETFQKNTDLETDFKKSHIFTAEFLNQENKIPDTFEKSEKNLKTNKIRETFQKNTDLETDLKESHTFTAEFLNQENKIPDTFEKSEKNLKTHFVLHRRKESNNQENISFRNKTFENRHVKTNVGKINAFLPNNTSTPLEHISNKNKELKINKEITKNGLTQINENYALEKMQENYNASLVNNYLQNSTRIANKNDKIDEIKNDKTCLMNISKYFDKEVSLTSEFDLRNLKKTEQCDIVITDCTTSQKNKVGENENLVVSVNPTEFNSLTKKDLSAEQQIFQNNISTETESVFNSFIYQNEEVNIWENNFGETFKESIRKESFSVDPRTGMTVLPYSQERETFDFIKRVDFVPKGFSPILMFKTQIEAELSPNSKEKFISKLLEEYEDELKCIKWERIIDRSDINKFFDELYAEECKRYEKILPLNLLPVCTRLPEIQFTKDILGELKVIGQADRKFIVALIKSTNCLLIIDQHAADERVRLENLLKAYRQNSSDNNKAVFRQTKFEKAIFIKIPNSQLLASENIKKHFENVGVTYQVCKSGLEVQGIPTCLYSKLFQSNLYKEKEKLLTHMITSFILEELEYFRDVRCFTDTTPSFLLELINLEACRGAIKFGDILEIKECENLLQKLSTCDLPFQCAHGRPTMLPLSQLNSSKILTEKKINLKRLKK